MNAVPPCVTERFDLFRLATYPFGVAFTHFARARARLPVASETNAIGRVQVDALHLAAQPLLLRQAVHHQQRIAENHPVRPVLGVRVELQLRLRVGDAVEIAEQIGLRRTALPALALQVADQRLGLHLLLDVDRHRRHAERRRVLRVLAAPDQLRVQIRVARIQHRRRSGLGLGEQRGGLGGRDVATGHVRRMAQGFQGGGRRGGGFGHVRFPLVRRGRPSPRPSPGGRGGRAAPSPSGRGPG